jgi:hypothetical protein
MWETYRLGRRRPNVFNFAGELPTDWRICRRGRAGCNTRASNGLAMRMNRFIPERSAEVFLLVAIKRRRDLVRQ